MSYFLFNIFSSFDLMFSFFQIPVYLFFLVLFSSLISFLSLNKNILLILFIQLSKFFHSLNKMFFGELLFVFSFSLIFVVSFFNLFSVFSYSFPFCSQASLVGALSISIWVSIFIKHVFKNLKGFLSHFTPEGAPIMLVPFLFVIEFVSNLIRPITLGVRLCANILAGHLLMILLSKLVLGLLILTPLYLVLNLVEFFVAVIQSYIFVTLTVLYYSELK